jgi:hypothetical protein
MPTGWFVFCCSHFLPRPKYSEFASESRGAISVLPESISVLPAAIGVLPAAVGRDAGPDLTANRIHRSTGFRPVHSPQVSTPPPSTVYRPLHRPTSFHPIHFPTALPCIRTIISDIRVNALLARRSRMQSVGSAPCNSYSTVGSILHAGLPAIRSPIEESAIPTIFFRGCQGMRKLAKQVPRLIHVSLFLFFLGLGDSMLNTNTTVGVTTIVPICLCGNRFYLYSVSEHLTDLQSPYKTLISRPIFFLIQKFQQLFGDRAFFANA